MQTKNIFGLCVVSNQKELIFALEELAPEFQVSGITFIIGVRPGLNPPKRVGNEKAAYRLEILEDFAETVEVNRGALANQIGEFDFGICVDPDEHWPSSLLLASAKWARQARQGVCGSVPLQYYVGSKPLFGTPWGGIKLYPRVLDPLAIKDISKVHQRFEGPTEPVSDLSLPVKHYWISTIEELQQKHDRYLRHEGEARFSSFGAFSWRQAAILNLKTLLSVLKRTSPRDGFLGLVLSFEFVRYQFRATLCHRKFSKSMDL